MMSIIILVVTLVIAGILSVSLLSEIRGHPKSIKLIGVKNNLKKCRELLLDDVNKAHHSFHMVLSYYYKPLFDPEEISNAFRDAKKRGVDIKIITGRLEKTENILVPLHNENVLALYMAKDFPLQNFRVVDTKTVHIEQGTLRESEHCLFSRYENNRFKALKYEKNFRQYLSR